MPAAPDATIILASASPQRRRLLESVSLPVQVEPSHVDEALIAAEPPEQAVVRLARRKAHAVAGRIGQRRWIVAADTAILIGAELLGKPRDRAAARSILGRLCGSEHRVLTGVAVVTPGGLLVTALGRTEVTFAALTDRELEWYLDTGEWRGAAGGYRIQGRAGMLVTGVHGSYSNVVGLPLETIYRMLARHDYPFRSQMDIRGD
jgi:septum formation protein